MAGRYVIPQTQDRETGPFFEAAKAGKLVVKHCLDCDNGLHPPSAHCPYCNGWNTDWKEVSGRGRLHSWSVVEHAVHPAFPAPYTIVLVDVEGVSRVRLVGNIAGRADLKVGMAMNVYFDIADDDVVFPNWRVGESAP